MANGAKCTPGVRLISCGGEDEISATEMAQEGPAGSAKLLGNSSMLILKKNI